MSVNQIYVIILYRFYSIFLQLLEPMLFCEIDSRLLWQITTYILIIFFSIQDEGHFLCSVKISVYDILISVFSKPRKHEDLLN